MATRRNRNRFEEEPLINTNVFILADLPPESLTTESIEILEQDFRKKFDVVTTINTSIPDMWPQLISMSQEAVNYYLTYPSELITAKPSITVAFLHWNTLPDFITNLIAYGQQTNPLVEDLLICDTCSTLTAQSGREIKTRLAHAGLLQNCYDIYNAVNTTIEQGLSDLIVSKSFQQQRARKQTYYPILKHYER